MRSEYERPDGADELPPADTMIVAPATCNTLAKWTAGISDTLPLGLVIEAVGKGLPVVAMPFGNRAQLSFPAIGEAMGKLQAMINSAMPSSTSIPTVTAPRTVNASSCQISSAITSGEFVQRPVQFNTVILSGVHGTDPGAPS